MVDSTGFGKRSHSLGREVMPVVNRKHYKYTPAGIKAAKKAASKKKDFKEAYTPIFDAILRTLNEKKKDKKWIQKAEKSIEKRGTEGVCTGANFGGSSCRPGTRRYALAQTFKKMASRRKGK